MGNQIVRLSLNAGKALLQAGIKTRGGSKCTKLHTVDKKKKRNRTMGNVCKNTEKSEKILFGCFELLMLDLEERIKVDNILNLI